ncbi:uncharacterized protein AKAW2_70598S [Aspergillus luchuensis]|uniref:Uncharacterized protein n=1 Tax=Aspergillus kawachii TaxID=1069201 RepID=A0A7R7WJ69_ASPKA|nr:uncharacterized protein AKAW2_70598S [Aspergillus luchuensis]BCS03720.1 hypothetical protein AKAW2_70598S [Aspergillus luchuensis]BCS15340.1 hypothetical protein ALUC_70573S [Aspergillus luchuensis]
MNDSCVRLSLERQDRQWATWEPAMASLPIGHDCLAWTRLPAFLPVSPSIASFDHRHPQTGHLQRSHRDWTAAPSSQFRRSSVSGAPNPQVPCKSERKGQMDES